MSLFHFGTSARRLLGFYEPPTGSGPRGAILCSPWGQEYIRAHQSIRFLGRLLAKEGLHVLRFDWYGTGDSAGGMLEGGEPESWLEDLDFAIEELKALAQISTVTLVGLRLGASVAAAAARARSEVDKLVLWDPIFDGGAYLHEISQNSRVQHPKAYRELTEPDGERTLVISGFPMTPAMRRGIRTIRLEGFNAPLPPTLLVSTVDDPERYHPLRRRLRTSAADFTDEVAEGPTAWVEEGDLGTAGMPVKALEIMAEWLA